MRQKTLLWRIANDCLATRDKLRVPMIDGEDVCLLRQLEKESGLHLFKNCVAARMLWFGSQWLIRIDKIDCGNAEEFTNWLLYSVQLEDKRKF